MNYGVVKYMETSVEEVILKKVEELLKKSNFYKRIYNGKKFKHFKDIPLINKNDLLLDQKLYPPFGSNLIVPIQKINRLHRTSGTSNTPLILGLTKQDVYTIAKTGAKAFKVAGMEPGDIVFNCMNYCMWMGGGMDHLSIEETGAVAIPYGVGNTENLIQLMLDLKPVCIHATPSYLSIIEKVAKEKFNIGVRELSIKKGFFGGEGGMQDKTLRDNIEKKWNMQAFDANYGMSEAMSIMGAECKYKNGLHFTAQEVLYPELKLEETDICNNNNIQKGVIGELVVTNLEKEAQPLIRYATGDIIEIISTEVCECGEKSFRFKVVGRRDDMIVVKGINFYPESIREIITQFEVCTGNYSVLIPESKLVDRIKLMIEIKTKDIDKENLGKIISKKIRSKYFVTCMIEFVTYLEVEGNKQKIVKKIKSLE